MPSMPEIHLFVADAAVLSSLEFALAVQGFRALDGFRPHRDFGRAVAVVVDQGPIAQAAGFITALRGRGCSAPAIVLVTNPTRQDREQAQANGLLVIEKPLLGDDVSQALCRVLEVEEAA